MRHALVPDWETFSECDLKAAGAWAYSEHPSTEVLCLGWEVKGERFQWRPDKDGYRIPAALQAALDDPECIFVPHNAGFEKAIWRNVMVKRYGWPDLPDYRWEDSMAKCAMLMLPQSLDRVTRVLGLEHEKDMEGAKIVKAYSRFDKRSKSYKFKTPANLERICDYNLSDIAAQVGLHNRVGWLPANERKVWLLDQAINQRGLRLDMEFVRGARRIVSAGKAPLEREFEALTSGIKVTQRDKFIEWMGMNGFYVSDLKKETVAAILGDDDDLEDTGVVQDGIPESVERALEIRSLIGSASIKKLDKMQQCVSADGRARGLLAYHGAGPGRWAGRLLQPQNFPRGTIRIDGRAPQADALAAAITLGDADLVEILFGPAVETVVSALRHAIIADPGKLLVAGDFASIEARIVLALGGAHDKLAIMAAGKDIYIDMAEAIYRMTVTKDDTERRQTGKNSVLGLGFQMGWKKFKLRYAKEMSDEFCKGVVKTYRESWAPGVPKVWSGLEHAALRTVRTGRSHSDYGIEYAREGDFLTARLYSGRKLWYPNPKLVRKAMPWSTEDEPDIREAWTYQAMKMGQWATIDAYGGLLTENVVQATARDLMVSRMFVCEREGLPIVLTVHDQIVSEVPAGQADPKVLNQIMCDQPEWARQMKVPIAADCWAGERFRK